MMLLAFCSLCSHKWRKPKTHTLKTLLGEIWENTDDKVPVGGKIKIMKLPNIHQVRLIEEFWPDRGVWVRHRTTQELLLNGWSFFLTSGGMLEGFLVTLKSFALCFHLCFYLFISFSFHVIKNKMYSFLQKGSELIWPTLTFLLIMSKLLGVLAPNFNTSKPDVQGTFPCKGALRHSLLTAVFD